MSSLLGTLTRGSGAAPTNTAPAAQPWQVLQTALAMGAAGAIYDPLATGKATASGGNISALADANGVAPSLSNLSGTIAFNATTGAMTFTGSNALWTAPSSVFDVSGAVSLWAILSSASFTDRQHFLCVANSGSYNHGIGITVVSPHYFMDTGDGGFNAGGTVTPDANIRLVIVSMSAGTGNIDIPAQARQSSGSAGTPPSAAMTLTLGGLFQGGNNSSLMYAAGWIPRVVSGGDISALQTYATSKSYVVA